MKITLKQISGIVGAAIAGIAIMLGATIIAYPAISSVSGLAVAQTATQWNNVIDAARGDAQQAGILGMSPYLWNGVTFDRQRGSIANGAQVDVTRLGGSSTPSDAFANPTTTNVIWVLNSLFNGTTWDRVRSATADALASTGMTAVGNMSFNGATFDRIRSATADALAATGIQTGNPSLFNGATFDRQDGVSATNNTATTSIGVTYQTQLSTWSVTDTDVGATQSIASRALGGGTVRHVATSITACRGDTAVAVPALINLRDGATGAGTIIRSWVIGVSAVNESRCVDLSGLNMTGTANTAMTLEFAAAGSATSTSTVTLSGYSTP